MEARDNGQSVKRDVGGSGPRHQGHANNTLGSVLVKRSGSRFFASAVKFVDEICSNGRYNLLLACALERSLSALMAFAVSAICFRVFATRIKVSSGRTEGGVVFGGSPGKLNFCNGPIAETCTNLYDCVKLLSKILFFFFPLIVFCLFVCCCFFNEDSRFEHKRIRTLDSKFLETPTLRFLPA